MTEVETSVASDADAELARLARRVERERAARLEAEAIAERGLRDLYEINKDLDRKVQERVAESERLAQRAALAERVKGEILASVSHELRTPLMAVVGALDLLKSEGVDADCLDAAIAGADRLRVLVDELFSVVDINSETQADPEIVELAPFVESLADEWRLRAMGVGALLVTSIEARGRQAWFDVERTKTALDRLIDNALNHGGTGTITVAAAMDDDELRLSVTDEGPGIEPHLLAGLLEPFETGDRSSTRVKSGMGLGLAVSKGLVELQDGTLTIESTPGSGTTVTATFPQVRALD